MKFSENGFRGLIYIQCVRMGLRSDDWRHQLGRVGSWANPSTIQSHEVSEARAKHAHPVRSLLFAAFLLSTPLAQAGAILQTETFQITSTPSPFLEMTPTLGADSMGSMVVYSSFPVPTSGGFGPGDIYYQRLQNGAPSGAPVAVTTDSRDDRLNDVSGDHIVYTSFENLTSFMGEIRLYQTSTGQTSTLASGITNLLVSQPKIAGNNVVWNMVNFLVGTSIGTSIQYYDINNPGGGVRTLLGPEIGSFDPFGIGDRLVTWSRSTTDTYDVYAYDFLRGNIINITQMCRYCGADAKYQRSLGGVSNQRTRLN